MKSVDTLKITPGVSMLDEREKEKGDQTSDMPGKGEGEYEPLRFEIFHDVKKLVVDIRLVVKLHLDLI